MIGHQRYEDEESEVDSDEVVSQVGENDNHDHADVDEQQLPQETAIDILIPVSDLAMDVEGESDAVNNFNTDVIYIYIYIYIYTSTAGDN
jgi:hypothetical protein